jgi:hypothetical protein
MSLKTRVVRRQQKGQGSRRAARLRGSSSKWHWRKGTTLKQMRRPSDWKR